MNHLRSGQVAWHFRSRLLILIMNIGLCLNQLSVCQMCCVVPTKPDLSVCFCSTACLMPPSLPPCIGLLYTCAATQPDWQRARQVRLVKSESGGITDWFVGLDFVTPALLMLMPPVTPPHEYIMCAQQQLQPINVGRLSRCMHIIEPVQSREREQVNWSERVFVSFHSR
jgi:hypothetical protein